MKAKKNNAMAANTSPTCTQTSIKASLDSTSVYPSSSQRNTEITNATKLHLAKELVSNEGFRKIINKLDKRVVIPSRNNFSNVAMPTLYGKCSRGEKREGSCSCRVGFIHIYHVGKINGVKDTGE